MSTPRKPGQHFSIFPADLVVRNVNTFGTIYIHGIPLSGIFDPLGAAAAVAIEVATVAAAVATIGNYSSQNKGAATIPAGGACAVHSSGVGVIRAQANAITTACCGMAQSAISPTFSGKVQIDGTFTLTDWTAITGTTLLAPHTYYYLDPANPAKLTATKPTTTGQVVQIVGQAVGAHTLSLCLSVPILL